ncbi:MAG: TIGR02300 family protein [Hyphomicrobiaceae bacterium]|nr:TIGR02300 family protein [Hyphomicrobiaceae bacterium]MCC0023963.1 TIGR02300 family protein [Hyphomicrobiaceae bacterium]
MAKAERGTKRQCLKCGTKFYDLNADPIVCPACGAPFLLEVPVPPTSVSKRTDDKETDEVETDEAALAAGAEIVSFEDAEEDSDNDEDDVLSDVDDVDDVDDIGGEVDNSFIEDDDDDDDDELGISVDRRNDDDE